MSKPNVVVVKSGAKKQFIDASTLAEARRAAGAQGMLATLNGDAVSSDEQSLSENDVITFTEQVKGNAPKARKPKAKKARKTAKVAKKATKRIKR